MVNLNLQNKHLPYYQVVSLNLVSSCVTSKATASEDRTILFYFAMYVAKVDIVLNLLVLEAGYVTLLALGEPFLFEGENASEHAATHQIGNDEHETSNHDIRN